MKRLPAPSPSVPAEGSDGVTVNLRGVRVIKREGAIDRNLFHLGGRVFNPSGAEEVRVRFEPLSERATTLTMQDGPALVTARLT